MPAPPTPIPSPHGWAERVPQGARAAIAILFAAAVVPVLLLLHPVGDYMIETDFYGGYAPGARALWHSGLDPARYGVVGPVYEIVLGTLGLLPFDLFRIAQFLSLASTVATLLLWSTWLTRRFGRGAGWIAALLIATNPTIVRYAYTASTDALYVALWSAAFVSLFPAQPTLAALARAGFLAGLATLTRYTGIVLVPLGALAALWPGRKAAWAGRRAAALGAFVLGVVAVLGPWWAFTQAAGKPTGFRFYHNLAYDVYARARGITWDEYQATLEAEFPTFSSVLTRDPAAVAARLAQNTYEHLAQAAGDLWLPPLAALAALGLALVLLRRAPGAGGLVALGALGYLALVPAFYASRYHMPLVPVAAALAAIALTRPQAFAKPLSRPALTRALGALAAAALVVALGVQVRATIADTRAVALQVPRELPGVGTALRRDWNGEGRPRLMARKPNLSYYAAAEPVPFAPIDSLEALAAYLREQRVDYLYVSWPEALMRPSFAFLLVPEFAPVGLDLVQLDRGGQAVLYRVRPEFGDVLPEWYPREWVWRAAEGLVRIHPNNPDFWLAAGEGRHSRRELPQAAEAYRRALELKPNWDRALANLGNLAADQGDFAAARQSYEAALRAGLRDAVLFRNLGLAAAQSGDLARADEALTQYLSMIDDPQIAPLLAQVRAQRAAGSAPGGP